jgi:hypothetical protein
MEQICPVREPSLIEVATDHWVSCWLFETH